jgi:3-deoxy-D-manno-octulosonic-acid transferase
MANWLDAVYVGTSWLWAPWYWLQGRRRGRSLPQLWARCTGRTASLGLRGSGSPRIWMHGVSAGEVALLEKLWRALQQRCPNVELAVSTTTTSGMEMAKKRFSHTHAFYFPLDFSWAVRRALAGVNPHLVVLAEAELWPNFLKACQRSGIPVALVNARLSDRTYRRLKRLPWLARRLYRCLSLISVQNELYAQRFRSLGICPDRLVVAGSMKFDGLETDRQNARTQQLRRLFRIAEDEVVLVAGSTSAPEEELVLAAYKAARARCSRLRLVLVPRHPERCGEVEQLVHQHGFACARRSQLPHAFLESADGQPEGFIILVDSVGELSAIWGLAHVGFVGGSFVPRGGQNMLEPAAYGVPTVFGPMTWNYRDAVEALLQVRGAWSATSPQQLIQAVVHLVTDPGLRERMGRAAAKLVAAHRGATERTAELLLQLLARPPSKAGTKYQSREASRA